MSFLSFCTELKINNRVVAQEIATNISTYYFNKYLMILNLFSEIRQNNKDNIQFIFKFASNLDLNLRRKGCTVLHEAARVGNHQVVCLILEKKLDLINLKTRDPAEETALHIAARKGHAKVVESLLRMNPESIANSLGHTPILDAAFGGFLQIVEMFLNKNPESINDRNTSFMFRNSLLHNAVQGGNVELVDMLLARKPDFIYQLNHRRETALFFAALDGHVQIVRRLLETARENETERHFINLRNDRHEIALHNAAKEGYVQIVQLLLDGRSDLYVRRESDDPGQMLRLQRSSNHFTPLHYAVQRNHFPIVRLLLQRNADPNIRNSRGQTALQMASPEMGNLILQTIRNFER